MENKYESKFSPGKLVSAEQILAEVICERLAKSKGIELPIQFWSHPNYFAVWEKEYLRQLRGARQLTKIYSPQAVSRALRTKTGLKVISLHAKFLDDLIKIEQRKLDLEKENKIEVESSKEEAKDKENLPLNRPIFKNKNNLRDKLDG